MEWVVWTTLFALAFTVALFVALYSYSDIDCVWPPCVSELIERHKSLTLLMFGFTTAMIWLNLVILSVIARADGLAAIATLMFFSVLGVFSFDLCEHRSVHYLSVLVYAFTSTLFANTVVSDKLIVFTVAVDLFTLLFLLTALFTAFLDRWHTVSKYMFTCLECGWILSFCAYVAAHAFENRLVYNSLFLVVDCAPGAPHEEDLRDILAAALAAVSSSSSGSDRPDHGGVIGLAAASARRRRLLL
jgi:hypothetical protein